jgi:hypothetical protein
MIGQTISHYHFVEKLGGRRAVYKAEDTSLGRILSYLACGRWLAFALMVIVACGKLASQTATDEQKPLRFDLTALVGYRTTMSFPTGHPPIPHLVLAAKPSYGISVGVRLDEENLIEFRWVRQDSHVHIRGSAAPDKKVVLDQFHGDFTREFILEDGPHWARPFVLASAGATHVDGGTGSSFTRFSCGIGGGIKVYFTRHFGVRMQGEWIPVVVEPEVTSFLCGSSCIVRLSARMVSQAEIVVGPVFRF